MTQYLTAILPVIFGWLPGYQVGYQGTKAQSPRLFRSPQVPRANRYIMYADTFCPKSVNLAKAGNILYAQKNKLSSLLHVLFCFLSHWSFGAYIFMGVVGDGGRGTPMATGQGWQNYIFWSHLRDSRQNNNNNNFCHQLKVSFRAAC